MVIVADTSPINYLVLIGAADVVPDLYGQVFVPPEVVAELRDRGTPEPVRLWVATPPAWLQVRAATSVDRSLPLDEGERAAIALALELRADRLLIDERDGRAVASQLGIPIAGTLAVLRDAASAGRIDLALAFEKLKQTTFRVAPSLLAQALEEYERAKRP